MTTGTERSEVPPTATTSPSATDHGHELREAALEPRSARCRDTTQAAERGEEPPTRPKGANFHSQLTSLTGKG